MAETNVRRFCHDGARWPEPAQPPIIFVACEFTVGVLGHRSATGSTRATTGHRGNKDRYPKADIHAAVGTLDSIRLTRMFVRPSVAVAAALTCLLGLHQPCSAKVPVYALSEKCLASGRHQIELRQAHGSAAVSDQCLAAAIAERAFQDYYHHKVQRYLIFQMPGEPRWHFQIEFDPPGPGAHCMVVVNPETGETRVVAGI
jgi:hypothetical protein